MGSDEGERLLQRTPMRVAFFADASSAIGVGHLTRSMVLAREFIDRGHDVLVAGAGLHHLSPSIKSLRDVPRLDMHCEDSDYRRLALVREENFDFVVVDGYHFTESFFEKLDDLKVPYGVIDDYARSAATNPRFVLDQNSKEASRSYVVRFPEAVVLAGGSYRLLRREIYEAKAAARPRERDPYLMVSLGGSDVRDLTTRIVEELLSTDSAVRVAVGRGVNNRDAIMHSLGGHKTVTLVKQEDYELTLARAKISITSAGTSLWESLELGVPTIALIVASNQVEPARIEAQNTPSLEIFDATLPDFSTSAVLRATERMLSRKHAPERPVKKETQRTAEFAAIRIESLINL